jgi:hypothetical protein
MLQRLNRGIWPLGRRLSRRRSTRRRITIWRRHESRANRGHVFVGLQSSTLAPFVAGLRHVIPVIITARRDRRVLVSI